MRIVCLLACTLLATACGGDNKNNLPDAPRPDAGQGDPDAPVDGLPDAPDAPDGIAEVRAAADGAVSLEVVNVVVTYIKPQLGNVVNDPAGFTVQRAQMGPAIFVTVDPATITPTPTVGDVVSFRVTMKGTVGGSARAQAIENYVRHSTGANVSALAQNVSAATDLLSAIDSYDAELVNITGTIASDFQGSGTGFQRAQFDTAGISGDVGMQFRVPATLVDSLDIVQGCTATATNVTMARFTNNGNPPLTQAQVGAYAASDFTLTNCPAPVVESAAALSSTSVRITFSRNILASSVDANGSQFTFDNGLVASAATVDDRTVTVTTGAQAVGTSFTVTVANTVTDLQGTGVGTPNTATFGGFVTPAVLKINEFNANITGGCDLIELRVVTAGSIAGFKLTERTGVNDELSFTFPAVVVAQNDIIVVHMNSANAACNPGGATAETTTETDQLAATFPGNFDTAFDFWVADAGLTATDNVFTLFDAANAIHDAVFASDDPAGTAAANTETAAALVGAANQWDPALATYVDDVFNMNAVQDLNGTGTAAIGNSIQRLDNTDDNNVGDWTTGAGSVSTFGVINVGQTPF